jgi:hypothetical protein
MSWTLMGGALRYFAGWSLLRLPGPGTGPAPPCEWIRTCGMGTGLAGARDRPGAEYAMSATDTSTITTPIPPVTQDAFRRKKLRTAFIAGS